MGLDHMEVLRDEERAVLALRSLYGRHGYSRYKMSRFEEYDLYAQNKDFLVSKEVITFTDLDGRLMALKPDVTLSIVRHILDVPGALQRVFYDERVYRASRQPRGFREILQAGLECLGAVDDPCLQEVLSLAAESLSLISDGARCSLEVSHLGVLSAALETVPPQHRPSALACAAGKNAHELARLPGSGALLRLLEDGRSDDRLDRLLSPLRGGDVEVVVDFSVVGDLNYYNGVVFRGFIDGIPAPVLRGGQYDQLARRMGRAGGAVGFALYLDLLERRKAHVL